MSKNPNKPGFKEAIRAKCFQCCGEMLDGRQDCEITDCPLYHWQPYKKLEPDLTWRTEGSHLQRNRKALREKYRQPEQDDMEDIDDTDLDDGEDEEE